MYKQSLFYLIFTVLFFSCTKNSSSENNFSIQPKILKKNSKFNIETLNFNEDVALLLSKSLDTINNNYNFKNIELARYPSKEEIKQEQERKYKRFVHMPEERYYFQSLPLDSIAMLDDIYFNKIAIETDKDLKIKTFLAYSDFYTTKELDATLHKLYIKYGQTKKMKEQERINKEYDRRRGITRDKPKSYEGYLYEYGQKNYAYTGKYHYHQWDLDDRILQIKIYEEYETEIDLTNGKSQTKNFHTIEFLFIKKEEYDSIKRILFKNMEKYKHGLEILKPYKIKTLSYEHNYSDFTREVEIIKEAKLEEEYQRSIKNE